MSSLITVWAVGAIALAVWMLDRLYDQWGEIKSAGEASGVLFVLLVTCVTWPLWLAAVLLYGAVTVGGRLFLGVLLAFSLPAQARIATRPAPVPLLQARTPPAASFPPGLAGVLGGQAVPAPVAPPELLTLRACVWGDSQQGTPVFRQVVAAMQAEAPAFLLTTGDVIQNRGAFPTEWLDQFLVPLAPLLHLPRFGCLGNHCDPLGFRANVCQLPSRLPGGLGLWQSVDVGPARFLFMDSNQESFELRTSMMAGGPQRAWLLAELARPRPPVLVAMFHAPAVTELWTGTCYYLRTGVEHAPWVWAMDTLAAAGCALVLNGHAHGYQRGTWRGMAWVVTGGGGGGLDSECCPDIPEVDVRRPVHHFCTLDISPTGLVLRALDLQRREFDRVEVRR